MTVMEVKGFLGLCVYYRIWIKDFAVPTNLLYKLTRGSKRGKDRVFEWGPEQQEAMDDLKQALIEAPALKPIDYEASSKIVLSVDSSLIGWGAILQQEDDLDAKQRHPSRYENGL